MMILTNIFNGKMSEAENKNFHFTKTYIIIY